MEGFVGVSRPNKRPLEDEREDHLEDLTETNEVATTTAPNATKKERVPFMKLKMTPITSYFRDIDFDCNQNLMVANLSSILFYKKCISKSDKPTFVFDRLLPIVASSSIDLMKYDVTNENLVTLSKLQRNIDIYDLYGGFIHTFSVGASSTPVDIAINQKNGNIIVSEFVSRRVQEFGSDGTFKRVISNDFHPYGVSVNHELGYLLVSDTLNKRVSAFSLDENKLLFRFGSEVLRCPESIVWDTNHNIYVGDAVNHCVQVFAKTGQFIESIPNLTSGSLAMDNRNHLYVSDYKKRAIIGFDLSTYNE